MARVVTKKESVDYLMRLWIKYASKEQLENVIEYFDAYHDAFDRLYYRINNNDLSYAEKDEYVKFLSDYYNHFTIDNPWDWEFFNSDAFNYLPLIVLKLRCHILKNIINDAF